MFHEMRYVYEVYRHRSFSGAAKALYISQPSLSLMVKKAETRIGSPIFDRSTSPVGLTEVGLAYIRAVRQVMQEEEEFANFLDAAKHCLTGTLSLGSTSLFMSGLLPPMISAFSGRYPGVEMRLHEGHTERLKNELQEGALDMVADNGAFSPAIFSSRVLCEERVILAVPAALSLNRGLLKYRMTASQIGEGKAAPPVPLSAFSEEQFVFLKEGNDTHIRADKLCQEAGFRPRIRLKLDQQTTAYNLAANGLGVAFVSDTLVRSAPPDDRLYFYRLEGEAALRSVRIFYKRSRHLTSPMRAFLDMLPEKEEMK